MGALEDDLEEVLVRCQYETVIYCHAGFLAVGCSKRSEHRYRTSRCRLAWPNWGDELNKYCVKKKKSSEFFKPLLK